MLFVAHCYDVVYVEHLKLSFINRNAQFTICDLFFKSSVDYSFVCSFCVCNSCRGFTSKRGLSLTLHLLVNCLNKFYHLACVSLCLLRQCVCEIHTCQVLIFLRRMLKILDVFLFGLFVCLLFFFGGGRGAVYTL